MQNQSAALFSKALQQPSYQWGEALLSLYAAFQHRLQALLPEATAPALSAGRSVSGQPLVSPADGTVQDSLKLAVLENFELLESLPTLGSAERAVLLVALAPQLLPVFYNQLVADSFPEGGVPRELGLVRRRGSYLPTLDTALFLLSGFDLGQRHELLTQLFAPTAPLRQLGLLQLAEPAAGQPTCRRVLALVPAVRQYLLYGAAGAPVAAELPGLPADFPAQQLTATANWDDLVLAPATRILVEDVRSWVCYQATLNDEWGMRSLFKPGYRVLFYGPSGTGKTLTATLLGRYTGRAVYRVDLSMVLSKYIGETEKNMARLFEHLQGTGTVLFFDEADALFGKRTETRDAQDRFANQQVAYLLQRIEEYDGLVVLASNLKGNLDTAFARRFQAMIPFPMPTSTEREVLWERIIGAFGQRTAQLGAAELAARYELSGASIANVVQVAALRALGRGQHELQLPDVVEGIRLEYQKNGRLL